MSDSCCLLYCLFCLCIHLFYIPALKCAVCFHYVFFLFQMSVDTLQFLLFLYIQQLNHVSLRNSLIGEEWPSHHTWSPSPSDREAKTSSQNKVPIKVKFFNNTKNLICLLHHWGSSVAGSIHSYCHFYTGHCNQGEQCLLLFWFCSAWCCFFRFYFRPSPL